MILDRFLAVFAVGALVCATAPARADVMEIGADGARWIAGPQVMALPDDAMPDDFMLPFENVDEAVVEGLGIPDHAVAHTHLSAAAVPLAYQAKVAELAARFDLSPALIEAMVWQESRWRADAVSPVGARGLAQLMPGTARELGVNSADPFANLEGGARYLRAQMDRFGGDVEKALAAYNAGPGRVIRSGGIPRIRETQLYVAAIMGRLSNHSREQ